MIIAALDGLVLYASFFIGIFNLHPDLNKVQEVLPKRQVELKANVSEEQAKIVLKAKEDEKTAKNKVLHSELADNDNK